jgi:FixJ family two-component response regulator
MRDQYLSLIDAPPRQTHSCFVKAPDEAGTIKRPVVAVVDDDESVRESLPDLLGEFGFRSKVFSSAEEFLASDTVSQMKCLVLDIAMPGMTGFDLQQELKVRGYNIPIVFITAQKDESVRKQALARGAVGFLFKPFSDTALLRALNTALGLD